jgi:hypothetical protein
VTRTPIKASVNSGVPEWCTKHKTDN